MWYRYFIGAIAIITIIRLALIMSGNMSAREKATKAGYWIIGLVMISISWNVLSTIFGANIGKIGGSNSSNSNKSDLSTGGYLDINTKKINGNNYFSSDYADKTDTVNIKITK